jgi:hypothetical protein
MHEELDLEVAMQYSRSVREELAAHEAMRTCNAINNKVLESTAMRMKIRMALSTSARLGIERFFQLPVNLMPCFYSDTKMWPHRQCNGRCTQAVENLHVID